jgi:hypothetical protein
MKIGVLILDVKMGKKEIFMWKKTKKSKMAELVRNCLGIQKMCKNCLDKQNVSRKSFKFTKKKNKKNFG